MTMDIYFLNHSGFMIDNKERCYIFDYNADPLGHVEHMAKEGRELWFFVSHVHSDHYRPIITEYDQERNTKEALDA